MPLRKAAVAEHPPCVCACVRPENNNGYTTAALSLDANGNQNSHLPCASRNPTDSQQQPFQRLTKQPPCASKAAVSTTQPHSASTATAIYQNRQLAPRTERIPEKRPPSATRFRSIHLAPRSNATVPEQSRPTATISDQPPCASKKTAEGQTTPLRLKDSRYKNTHPTYPPRTQRLPEKRGKKKKTKNLLLQKNQQLHLTPRKTAITTYKKCGQNNHLNLNLLERNGYHKTATLCFVTVSEPPDTFRLQSRHQIIFYSTLYHSVRKHKLHLILIVM